MNNKYFQRIIAFAAVILFAMPLSLKAQTEIETHYEKAQKFSNEELAQMLAPIALYPDALLSQMLIAASYPFEVVEADRWMSKNPNLQDEALDNALSQKDWDVSVLSLCHYPKVLHMMSENINWTAKLGDAFVNQEQDLMDTVQDLRARASAQGNLTTTDEQKVIVEERIIRIEPAYPSYLYVPVYDPLVIYGPWWFPAFMPFPIFYPGVVVFGPRIVFGPRLFVGFGVIGWSAFNWHAHNVVIMNIDRTRRFYRHADVYHRPEHVQWRPDHQRREVRVQRAHEIPRLHPSVKSPRTVPEGGFKRGADVVVPPRGKIGYERPRVIDKDKRPIVTPKATDKSGSPHIGEPRVIDKDRRPNITPKATDKGGTPHIGGPRIIDKGNPQQPQPRIIEKGKPVVQGHSPSGAVSVPQNPPRIVDRNKPIVRDRGSAATVKPPQTQPSVENKGVTRTVKGAERGSIDNQRDFQGEGRGGSDRGNERGNGGGREGRR